MLLAIDLGATNIKAALFDRQINKLTETVSIPTRAELGRAGIVAALRQAVNSFDGVSHIAVSSAGDVDSEQSRITYATENLPGMSGFDFAEFFASLGKDGCAINDGQAALLGEANYGAAKGKNNVLMLTLGSGVGGAYLADGKIVCNEKNDFGRYGHFELHAGGKNCTCGKTGCIESYLSGRAIHARAAELGVDGDDVFVRALGSCRRCRILLITVMYDLDLALKMIYNVSPFELCILGGGVTDWIYNSGAFDFLRRGIPFPIEKAVLGNDAGLYGACVQYRQKRGEW